MEVQFHDMICVCFQKRLLAAMEPYSHKLAPSEKARNRHTECAVYCFDKELDYVYNSPLPQLFPNIVHCRVRYVLHATVYFTHSHANMVSNLMMMMIINHALRLIQCHTFVFTLTLFTLQLQINVIIIISGYYYFCHISVFTFTLATL